MVVHLQGQLICTTPDEAARVAEHLPAHVALTRAEPGCLAFDVRPVGALVWQVEEAFVDHAAFAAHQTRTAASVWARATAGIRRDFHLHET
jgi:quinol monooxygenase YgiN